MSDLIKRNAAIFAILEYCPSVCDNEYECGYDDGLRQAVHKLKHLPTADVVEVVRCKDCKWFNDWGCAIRIVDETDKPKGDDFCSFGERRDDGD